TAAADRAYTDGATGQPHCERNGGAAAHGARAVHGTGSRCWTRGIWVSSHPVRAGGNGFGQSLSGARLERHGVVAAVERDAARSRSLQVVIHASRSSSVMSATTRQPLASERSAASMIAMTVAPCCGVTGFGAPRFNASRNAT